MIKNNDKIIDVVAGVLLFDYNKIILCKTVYTHKHFPCKWEFPGGKVESGECLQDALKRELKEELGIIINSDNIHPFPNNSHQFGSIKLTLFIVCHWDGDIKINHDIHSQILSINYADLQKTHDIVINDQYFIKEIQSFIEHHNEINSKS